MDKELKIKWLDEPEEHDYPAAESYLKLLFDDKTVVSLLERLKRNSMTGFKAKDIFRASGLSLLGVSNSHVEKDLTKIREGNKLSPLLLVRHGDRAKVIIADGYHRLCAVYSVDEDAMIPCKIV
jgi:hypothetical protein